MAQLHNDADHATAIRLLEARVKQIPNVKAEPQPDVEILQFNPLGPMLAVRPYCSNEHYWQVYFDTNRVIRETLEEGGFHAAEQAIVVRTSNGIAATSPMAAASGRAR